MPPPRPLAPKDGRVRAPQANSGNGAAGSRQRGGGAVSKATTGMSPASAAVASFAAAARHKSKPSSLWFKLNFTVQAARLQALKKQKYQHLQEEALLRARGLLDNWEDGPVLLTEDLYRRAAGERDAQELMNYTPEALALRFSLRNDSNVLEAVRALWQIEMPRDALGCIDQRAYTALFRRIGACLESESRSRSSKRSKRGRKLERTIQQDWERDSRGESTMSFANFFDAVFELADLWCDTIEVGEYIDFLERLLVCVSVQRKKGKSRMMRPVKQVKAMDDDSSESESESESDSESEEEEEEEEEGKPMGTNTSFLQAKAMPINKPPTAALYRGLLNTVTAATTLASLRFKRDNSSRQVSIPSVIEDPVPLPTSIPPSVRQGRRTSILNTVQFGANGLEFVMSSGERAGSSGLAGSIKSPSIKFHLLSQVTKESLSSVHEYSGDSQRSVSGRRNSSHGSIPETADFARMLRPQPLETAGAPSMSMTAMKASIERKVPSRAVPRGSAGHLNPSVYPDASASAPLHRSSPASQSDGTHAASSKNTLMMTLGVTPPPNAPPTRNLLATTTKPLVATGTRDQGPLRAPAKTTVGLRRQPHGSATQASHLGGDLANDSFGALSILGPGKRQDPSAGPHQQQSGRVGVGVGAPSESKFRVLTHQRPGEVREEAELVVAAQISAGDNIAGQSHDLLHPGQGGILYPPEGATTPSGFAKLQHQNSFGGQVFVAGSEVPTITREVSAASTQRRAMPIGSGTETARSSLLTQERSPRYEVVHFDESRPSRPTLTPSSASTLAHLHPNNVANDSDDVSIASNGANQKSFSSNNPTSGLATDASLGAVDTPPDFSESYFMTSYQSPDVVHHTRHGMQHDAGLRVRGDYDTSGSTSPASSSAPLWFSLSKVANVAHANIAATATSGVETSQGKQQRSRGASATVTRCNDSMVSPWETGDSDSEDDLARAVSESNQYYPHRRDNDGFVPFDQPKRLQSHLPRLEQASLAATSTVSSRAMTAPSFMVSKTVSPSRQRQQISSRVSTPTLAHHRDETSDSLRSSASTPALPRSPDPRSDHVLGPDQGLPLLATSLSVAPLREGSSPVYPSGTSRLKPSPSPTQRAKTSRHGQLQTHGIVLSDSEIEEHQANSQPPRHGSLALDGEVVGKHLPTQGGRSDNLSNQRPFTQPSPLQVDEHRLETAASPTTECGRVHTAPSSTTFRLDTVLCGNHAGGESIHGGSRQCQEDDRDALLLVNDERTVVELDPQAWEREVREKVKRKTPSRADMMRRRMKYSFGK